MLNGSLITLFKTRILLEWFPFIRFDFISCPPKSAMKYSDAICQSMYDNSEYLQNIHEYPLYNELPIIVDFAGETYAGRLDLIITVPCKDEIADGVYNEYEEWAVADIKTTSTLDKEYLGHQLNLYRLGVEKCYGIVIQKLYGIHLRKGTRKLVEIPIRSEEWLAKSLNIPGV